MIETRSDYNRFIAENERGDWIVHIVPIRSSVHPADTAPCILFIRNILTGKTYYYSFCHPDSKTSISEDEFIVDQLENTNNIKWALDKKSFTQFILASHLNDANLCGFLKKNEILELIDYETPAHSLVRRNSPAEFCINEAIPLLKHKEAFDEMADDIETMIKPYIGNHDNSYDKINKDIIETLATLEYTGVFVDKEKFEKYFHRPGATGFVYTQYNIYTSTGRPSNRFGGVNYAALNHDDGSRSCFISRFGDNGRMVLIDYSAFHPHIICKLLNYNLPEGTDIYKYLARLYFLKEEIDEIDINNAKRITFKQFYGGVEDKYAHIKYLGNLKSYIEEQWRQFKKNGYIETPFFKRKITEYHIQDPNPTKLFNYILQAAEGEIAIPRLDLVQKYLKNHQSKAVLYTYDSILFDFHKDDGPEVLNSIRSLMSQGEYPTKTYVGKSYHDLQLVNF